MTPRHVYGLVGIAAALVSAPVMWHEIDRSPPLEYVAAYFDRAEARPGETVRLTLKIRWPRTNCSTELERTFISSADNGIHKILDSEGRSTIRLGPPPPQILDANGIATSTREVTLPRDLPDGIATHSPNAWERCTSPAVKWGDYLTEMWPIFVGPQGAGATIMIRK